MPSLSSSVFFLCSSFLLALFRHCASLVLVMGAKKKRSVGVRFFVLFLVFFSSAKVASCRLDRCGFHFVIGVFFFFLGAFCFVPCV